MATAAVEAPAATDRTDIGVTAAVRPNATGTPPELLTRILHVGLDLSADERIDTGPSGQTHLLFRDGSALTVGPNSSVVLDSFIYDPESKTGELVMSATKGLFRFVGGRISKTKAVEIKTPTAIIGIRGGVAMMEVNGEGDGSVSATMIYGDEVTMSTPDGSTAQTMTRPGFTVRQQAGGSIGAPTPATQDELNSALSRLEEPQGQDDDTPLGQIAPAAGGPAVGDEDVAGSQLSVLGSGNDPAALAPAGGTPLGGTSLPRGTESEINEQQQLAATQPSDDDGTDDPGENGSGSGGGSGGSRSSSSTSGAVSGRTKTSINGSLGTNDLDPDNNQLITDSVLGSSLDVTLIDGSTASIPVGTGTFSAEATVLPNGTDSLVGTGVLNDAGDFLYYHLIEDDVNTVVAWVGVPTPSSAIPQSGTTIFNLVPDFTMGNTEIPFLNPVFHGNPSFLAPDAAPNAYINWNNNSGSTYPALYSSTIVINGQGSNQQSAASVTLGRVMTTSNGKYFVNGDTRGSARVSPFATSGVNAFFAGGVSSADNALGNDLFGVDGPNSFPLEAAAVNSEDVTTGFGIASHASSNSFTYFPNVLATGNGSTVAGQTRTDRTLNGFTAGFSQNYNPNNDFDRHAFNLTSEDPLTEFVLITDPATNTASATISVTRFGPDDTTRSFLLGDQNGSSGHSAFIDDQRFALIEPAVMNDVSNSFDPLVEEAYLVTHDQVSLQGALDSGSSLCACQYVTWGFWGMRTVFDDGSSATNGSRIEAHLIPFVAGEFANASQLNPATPVTATYQGTVIGTVVNGGLNSQTSSVYKEFADISMTFSVAAGSATMTSGQITNFENSTLTLNHDGSSGNQYVASLSGTVNNVNVGGFLTGSFVGPGTPPANTIGQGSISNDGDSYSARFVYFAQQQAP